MDTINSTPWYETAAIVVAVIVAIITFFSLLTSRKQTNIQATGLMKGEDFAVAGVHTDVPKQLVKLQEKINNALIPFNKRSFDLEPKLYNLLDSFDPKRGTGDSLRMQLFYSADEITKVVVPLIRKGDVELMHFEFLSSIGGKDIDEIVASSYYFLSAIGSDTTQDPDSSWPPFRRALIFTFQFVCELVSRAPQIALSDELLIKITEMLKKFETENSQNQAILTEVQNELEKHYFSLNQLNRIIELKNFSIYPKLRVNIDETLNLLKFILDYLRDGNLFRKYQIGDLLYHAALLKITSTPFLELFDLQRNREA